VNIDKQPVRASIHVHWQQCQQQAGAVNKQVHLRSSPTTQPHRCCIAGCFNSTCFTIHSNLGLPSSLKTGPDLLCSTVLILVFLFVYFSCYGSEQ